LSSKNENVLLVLRIELCFYGGISWFE